VALLSVINDILDFSKIESGRLELRYETFEPRELIDEVVDTLAEVARRKGLEFSSLVPVTVPVRVIGSMTHLRQILINLTGNAIKYTESGSVMVRVAPASIGAESARLRFEVGDTGIGIAQDKHAYIFEPFTQVSDPGARKQGGTGLGLSICKQLVEKMGGEIGVASEQGRGATFWFEVPLGLPAAEPAAVPGRRQLAGIRALVVDDNEVNREILRHQLAALGMSRDEAETGEAALEKLRAAVTAGRSFDIVVLDDRMPRMSGLELARAIRADPALRQLPLVMLSSVGHDEESSIEAGIEFFLTRPVRQSLLHDTLTEALKVKIAAGIAQQARGLHAQLDAHVLLVEDNPVNQELAQHMLEHLGCTCVIARHGREALVALEGDTAFDAILMDCQMPEMDGFEATAAIRVREAQGVRKRLPIIALTAGAVEGDRDKCLAAGMDDYLSKPFSLDQLEGILRRCLPVVPAIEPGEPHVDPQVIESMLVLGGGGSELLKRMVDIYLDDAPSRLEIVREGMQRSDPGAVSRAAHALKSASANLGAAALAELCRRLERACVGGSTGETRALVDAIELELAYVTADLSRRVRETAA
jgi:CheY-like chemotaxis protein